MSFISRFFRKGDETFEMDRSESYSFILKINGLEIGHLEARDGTWKFRYAEEFKNQNEYRRLTGFSDMNKEYSSKDLWPFFKVRIPGLKQPMIQEILEREKLDKTNEALLLQRFGTHTMTNPYVLEAS